MVAKNLVDRLLALSSANCSLSLGHPLAFLNLCQVFLEPCRETIEPRKCCFTVIWFSWNVGRCQTQLCCCSRYSSETLILPLRRGGAVSVLAQEKQESSTPRSFSTPSLSFPTPLRSLCCPSILLHYTQLKKWLYRSLSLSSNPQALSRPSKHIFLSAPSLLLESAQNEGSSLSGVNRRCVGGAQRMTSLGSNANILPSSRLQRSVRMWIVQ